MIVGSYLICRSYPKQRNPRKRNQQESLWVSSLSSHAIGLQAYTYRPIGSAGQILMWPLSKDICRWSAILPISFFVNIYMRYWDISVCIIDYRYYQYLLTICAQQTYAPLILDGRPTAQKVGIGYTCYTIILAGICNLKIWGFNYYLYITNWPSTTYQ